MITQSTTYGYKIALWSKLIGPIFCVFLNNFKYGSYDSNLFGMLLGLHYQSIFLAQGVLDTFYLTECLKYRAELSKTILAPLSIGGFYVLVSFTAPTNHSDTGFLFYYPIYFGFLYQSLYAIGTWQWVYALVWMMREHANERYSEWAYQLIVGSSMWAYISHYFFVVLSSNYIVRPLQLSYYSAVLTNLLFTWACILLTNCLLERLTGSRQRSAPESQIGLAVIRPGKKNKQ